MKYKAIPYKLYKVSRARGLRDESGAASLSSRLSETDETPLLISLHFKRICPTQGCTTPGKRDTTCYVVDFPEARQRQK